LFVAESHLRLNEILLLNLTFRVDQGTRQPTVVGEYQQAARVFIQSTHIPELNPEILIKNAKRNSKISKK